MCALDLHASRSHATNLLPLIANCWLVGALTAAQKGDSPNAVQSIDKIAHSMMKFEEKDTSERPNSSLELYMYPQRTTSMKNLHGDDDCGLHKTLQFVLWKQVR